jgi:hypothetical protein
LNTYTEKEKEEKKTRQDSMVFRKIFKDKRESISGRTNDDEGSIVISYDDRYDVLVTSALKNCDYDAAFTTSSPITTVAAAPSNNTANRSDSEDERQMDDDDDADAGWDTTIHVNENKYKATTTSTSASTGSNNEYTTTYSSWLTSCLNCV